MVKSKILNFLIIITSLIGYLEWGGGQKTFLFQAEGVIISKLFTDSTSVMHPFTILPMVGQIILFITLFQNRPNRILTITGFACLGLLLGFMFIIGLISLNYKIVLSTLPFLGVAILTIKNMKRKVR